MKVTVGYASLELLANNSNQVDAYVVFSFGNDLLPNAKIHNLTFNKVDELSDNGNIVSKNIDNSCYLVVSLGKKNDFSLAKYRIALNGLGVHLKKTKHIQNVTIVLENDLAKLLDCSVDELYEFTIVNSVSGLYYFHKFKSKQSEFNLNSLSFNANDITQAHVDVASIMLDGINLIKNLGNTPANIATPTYVESLVKPFVNLSQNVNVEVLGRDALAKLNMNTFLAVAQGSQEEPKLITLEYFGNSKDKKPVVLVGKGVTFDSGGISLKPRDNMSDMKYDMMGAATVIGVFMTVVKLNLPINLIVIAPCTENLPSGSAIKPGDVVTSMSGKTIEILNTDAEGRLILSDALTYAKKYNPEVVIDLATLTGACITALGHVACALYSNDTNLSNKLLASSIATDDKMWQMPLFEEYKELITGSIADLRNLGSWSGAAGSITAAKFLEQFASEYSWAHLDIAGVAYQRGDYDGNKGGATGRPFSLIMHFLRSLAN